MDTCGKVGDGCHSLLSASLPTGQSCEQHTLRLHTAGPPDIPFLYTDSSSVVLCTLIYQIINFLPVYVAKGDIQRWQCGLMENMWVLESILMCLPAPPFIQPIMSDLWVSILSSEKNDNTNLNEVWYTKQLILASFIKLTLNKCVQTFRVLRIVSPKAGNLKCSIFFLYCQVGWRLQTRLSRVLKSLYFFYYWREINSHTEMNSYLAIPIPWRNLFCQCFS